MRVRVRVPASSANLGPGFDTLGLALAMYLEVTAEPAPAWRVTLSGHGADELPADTDHLTVQMLRAHHPQVGPLSLHIHNGIPTCGGFGGSAAAMVAGLMLGEWFAEGRAERKRVFTRAADREGHPDNVAPAVYGGLRISGRDDAGWFSHAGTLHASIGVVAAIPEVRVHTDAMRAILPDEIPETVRTRTRALIGSLLEGLARGDCHGLSASSRDVRHQPYRFAVQPVPRGIFEAMCATPGIEGAFLSGSGTAVVGWVLDETDPRADLQRRLAAENITAETIMVPLDRAGAVAVAV